MARHRERGGTLREKVRDQTETWKAQSVLNHLYMEALCCWSPWKRFRARRRLRIILKQIDRDAKRRMAE